MYQANALERPPTVEGVVFDSLFSKVLRPTGAFADELRRAGFDPQAQHGAYPLDVFARCVDAAGRRLAPGRSLDGALRELGQKLLDGVFMQPNLRLIGMTLPMFGPERYLASAFCWSWLEAMGFEMTATRENERGWRLALGGPDEIPAELLAGAVERGLEKTGVRAQVEIVELRASTFTLRVSW